MHKLQKKLDMFVLEIDWKEVRVTLNGNEVNLPTTVIKEFRETSL